VSDPAPGTAAASWPAGIAAPVPGYPLGGESGRDADYAGFIAIPPALIDF
jgi:hypothetical protein